MVYTKVCLNKYKVKIGTDGAAQEFLTDMKEGLKTPRRYYIFKSFF